MYEHCGSGPVPEAAGEGLDDVGKEILSYVGKLSNHITADSASRNLKRYILFDLISKHSFSLFFLFIYFLLFSLRL